MPLPETPAPPLGRRRWLAGAAALAGAGALGAVGALRLRGGSGPMRQRAYVWQYGWTEAVSRAVRQAGGDFSGLIALGAEVRWGSGGEAQTRVVGVDREALRGASVPLGMAVRVHGLRGDPGPRQAAAVAGAIEAARGRLGGPGPAEVQIDFDCAAARLEGYRRWLDALRPAMAGARVTITALPSWLRQRAFAALASSVDGYALQVHGLEDPRGKLFDADRARRAVAMAGALGRPFWLALPTYSYRVAFDAEGRAAGVAAEGPAGGWDEGWQERRVGAEPAAVAALVRSLTEARPTALEGLLWYRLPVEGDRQNWSMATLRAVQRGRTPRGRLRAEAFGAEGLWTLWLVNDGDDEVTLRGAVRVRWAGGQRVASDALAGMSERREGDEGLTLEATAPLGLGPGERRAVGWVRMQAGRVEIDVDGEAVG